MLKIKLWVPTFLSSANVPGDLRRTLTSDSQQLGGVQMLSLLAVVRVSYRKHIFRSSLAHLRCFMNSSEDSRSHCASIEQQLNYLHLFMSLSNLQSGTINTSLSVDVCTPFE